MEGLVINDMEIIKTEKRMFSHDLYGVKYRLVKEGVEDVLFISANFQYEYRHYYNLYNSKGEVFKEDYFREVKDEKKEVSVKEMRHTNLVVFLDGDFRLIVKPNERIITIDEVEKFKGYLTDTYNCYSDAYYNKINYKQDLLPTYTIVRGHSRRVYGLLSRAVLQMTYKELECKIKDARTKFSEYIKYNFEEDLTLMENDIVKDICDYLMIKESQYKSGRFNIIDQLNKRLNYNINNKNK